MSINQVTLLYLIALVCFIHVSEELVSGGVAVGVAASVHSWPSTSK